ncbi:MAG TPA: hypothetical protein ENI64_01985 [Gammaproteobacteria bacterium]|nr:hypothetical protein [Gammaproteobacteria bacterium]
MGRLEHSIAIRPCAGERCSGDVAVIREIDGTTILAAIVDVTGHGYEASKTAAQIESFLQNCLPAGAELIMSRLHDTLIGTQGASVGLCLIDTESGSLEYMATGNTVFKRYGEHDVQLVSRDGIVGLNMNAPQVQKLALNNRDLVLMHTDGISSKFRFESGSSALHQQTSVITNKLIRDFGKDHDDAGCIALRYRDH